MENTDLSNIPTFQTFHSTVKRGPLIGMMNDAAQDFYSQNTLESFQGKHYFNSSRNLSAQLLKNPILKNHKLPNPGFLDKTTTALIKPRIHMHVLEVKKSFLEEHREIPPMLADYRSTSDSSDALCKRDQSLIVLHKQPEVPVTPVVDSVFAMLLLIAKKMPQGQRFTVPNINVDEMMDIAPKATAMGPLNLTTKNSTVSNILTSAKKTDLYPVQRILVSDSIEKVEQGGFPVVYPTRPAEKGEVVKKTRENRMIFVASSISTRIASHFTAPFEKAITGTIELGSPLGLAMEEDFGQRLADWWEPRYGDNPWVLFGDKKNNEAHETSDGALAYLGCISRFYEGWTDKHARLFSGNFTEYILPHILVGETIISPPRTGVVPSGSTHTRIGNCFRNFYETLLTLQHIQSTKLLPNRLTRSLYESFSRSMEGGDDKMLPLSNKLDEIERDSIVEAFRVSSVERKQPYGTLGIQKFVSDYINLAGEIEGGVEFQKHYFVREHNTGRVFYTRDSKRVFTKLLIFKSDMTPEIFLSNILKCMEQVPGNPCTFMKLQSLKNIVVKKMEENKQEITDECLRNYIQKSFKSAGNNDLHMGYEDVLLLNSGAYTKVYSAPLHDAIFRKYGVSANAVVTTKSIIHAHDSEKVTRDLARALEELVQGGLTRLEAGVVLMNSTSAQGALRESTLNVKLGKFKGKQFTARRGALDISSAKSTERRRDLLDLMALQFEEGNLFKVLMTLDVAILFLFESREYRSESLTKDLTSRKAEFPNPTWDNTQAKFYNACLHAKLPKGGIVFHPGCGSIASRSVHGIIQALQPKTVIAIDPNVIDSNLVIGETEIIYRRGRWDFFVPKQDFIIVSDVSFSFENQVDISSTNAENFRLSKIGKGVFKQFIEKDTVPFHPVYKHAAHNLEYFTSFAPPRKGDYEKICCMIYQGNKVRNTYYSIGAMERGVEGKRFLPPKIKDVDIGIPKLLSHPKRMSLDYQMPRRTNMQSYLEEDESFHHIIGLFLGGDFHTEANPRRPPKGPLLHSCCDDLGFHVLSLSRYLAFEQTHPHTIDFSDISIPYVF